MRLVLPAPPRPAEWINTPLNPHLEMKVTFPPETDLTIAECSVGLVRVDQHALFPTEGEFCL